MYRLIYRNPFLNDDHCHVVQVSEDLDEVKQNLFNIVWSICTNKTLYDEEFIWIEDLATGKKL